MKIRVGVQFGYLSMLDPVAQRDQSLKVSAPVRID